MKNTLFFFSFFLIITHLSAQNQLNATINIGSSSNVICEGESISFSSIGSTGNIINYTWDFDNQFQNQIGTGPFEVTFNNPGLYNIQLTVSDGILFHDTVMIISVLDVLEPIINHINPTECGGTNGQITLSNLAVNSSYNLYYSYNSLPIGPVQIQTNSTGSYTLNNLSTGEYSDFSVVNFQNDNLVPNGGFDIVNECFTQFFAPWGVEINTLSNWSSPTFGTPDPFNSCHTGYFLNNSTPSNFMGYQAPYNGNGYTGLMTLTGDDEEYREYLEVELTSPLNAGTTYNLSFRYSLSNKSSWASDNLGLLLSNDMIGSASTSSSLNLTPSLEIPNYTQDTVNWKYVTGTYLAMGGEQYILLGNFRNNSNTNYIQTGVTPIGVDVSYYYIDDVVVAPYSCPATIDTTLFLTAPFTVDFIQDSVFCDVVDIVLETNLTASNTLWQDGSFSNQYVVNQPGVYWFTVDSMGCVGSDTASISVIQSPNIMVNSDSICLGESTLLIASGANDYIWESPETLSSNSGTEVISTPFFSTTYMVIGSISNCYDTAFSVVTVAPVIKPTVSFYPEQLYTDNNDVIYFNSSPINNQSSSWYFNGNLISESNQFNYMFSNVSSNLSVQLISENSIGCLDTTNLTIIVLEDIIYYIPNSFTPDGDEFNNVFSPVISSGVDETDYRFIIYNRWGQIVFETTYIHAYWDGTFNGQKCIDGMYSWTIEMKSKNSSKKIIDKGFVNLLR